MINIQDEDQFEDIKGVKVSPIQAIEFSKMLGVIVVE